MLGFVEASGDVLSINNHTQFVSSANLVKLLRPTVPQGATFNVERRALSGDLLGRHPQRSGDPLGRYPPLPLLKPPARTSRLAN